MIKKIHKRKCLVCKTKFIPLGNNHVVCSVKCATTKGNEKFEKKKAQLKKTEWTKERAEMKEKLKTHKDYLKILQAVFNTYIRLRDAGKLCICCDKPLTKTYHAGHFYSVGAYPNLRFHEDNAHGQREDCNLHKHGNIAEYSIRLPIRIGQERFSDLKERRADQKKLSIPEIKELIAHYKQKIKDLK